MPRRQTDRTAPAFTFPRSEITFQYCPHCFRQCSGLHRIGKIEIATDPLKVNGMEVSFFIKSKRLCVRNYHTKYRPVLEIEKSSQTNSR